MANHITPELISASLSYTDYRALVETLFEQGKVTGPTQSEFLTNYTKMNIARMKRHEKTTVVPQSVVDAAASLPQKLYILVISEGWCGDAAQVLPVFEKVCDTTDLLEMRVILRDEHPEIMDQYLTNGARSIPKVIGLKADTLEEIFVWGPRPEPAAKLRLDMLEQGVHAKDIAEALHKWYATDRSVHLLAEIQTILTAASIDLNG